MKSWSLTVATQMLLRRSGSELFDTFKKEIHAILTETLGEHSPSYATVKKWVAKFKGGDFSTCDVPRPGRPKTVTTPEIIYQIHELILEDRRISAKSLLSNWASPVSGLGPLFMMIWTCGSSPRNGSRNS